MIYTSGSTGAPKGVAIEHRNAVALLCWAGSVFSHRELAGVLASTSICFDLSVFEIFVPLSWGGKIILVEDALALRDGAPVGEITLINTVPSALSELLATGGLPESVRTVNLAGEPLPTELVRRIYQCGVDQVYDLYGPSETTTYSTFTRRAEHGRATIGRPIANTKIYLLDAALRAGADRRARRALHRRRRRGARLLAPTGIDCGKISPRPVLPQARHAHVSHRRSGPLSC